MDQMIRRIPNVGEEMTVSLRSTASNKHVIEDYRVKVVLLNSSEIWLLGCENILKEYTYKGAKEVEFDIVATIGTILFLLLVALILWLVRLYAVVPEQEEGIEHIVLTEKAKKVIVDGMVYIVRDNKIFDLTGTQVK